MAQPVIVWGIASDSRRTQDDIKRARQTFSTLRVAYEFTSLWNGNQRRSPSLDSPYSTNSSWTSHSFLPLFGTSRTNPYSTLCSSLRKFCASHTHKEPIQVLWDQRRVFPCCVAPVWLPWWPLTTKAFGSPFGQSFRALGNQMCPEMCLKTDQMATHIGDVLLMLVCLFWRQKVIWGHNIFGWCPGWFGDVILRCWMGWYDVFFHAPMPNVERIVWLMTAVGRRLNAGPSRGSDKQTDSDSWLAVDTGKIPGSST